MAVVVPGKPRNQIIKGRERPSAFHVPEVKKGKNREGSFRFSNMDDVGGLD